MSDHTRWFNTLAWRAVFAAPFFAIGILGVHPFISPFFCLVGAIIIASPLAELIARPSGWLFWPGRSSDPPRPAYSSPQAKRASGLYEEAIAELEKIAQDYPDEVQPYVEAIDIAITDLEDAGRAKRIYLRGVSVLKKAEDRETLERIYRTRYAPS
jgi:hypothetical protein